MGERSTGPADAAALAVRGTVNNVPGRFFTLDGNPVRFRQRQDPKPGEKEGMWIEGEALRIELDDRNQKIELFDKARVNRGGDEVAGDYIFVDQRADFYQVSSGKGGAEKPGRVKAIIQSKPPAK